MNNKILDHYLQFGTFTFPGNYQEYLKTKLPDSVEKIGLLVRKQLIHRMVLQNGNTGSNSDLRYGDMTKVPWFRQPEDDVLTTASSMLAELFRRDKRGFVMDRAEENKLIVTCRFVSVLMASILKSKGIPARVRSGFAPYFVVDGLPGGKSDDHWINQYWDKSRNRWVTIDVDGSFEGYLKFDPYNMPENAFDFSADAWLNVRSGKVDGRYFFNAGGYDGLIVVGWELFYDFNCLMNNEIIYLHGPTIVKMGTFEKLSEKELSEIDSLARLMQEPDKNFEELKKIWETNKKFRLLKGALL